jgi:hypothetical protein
MNEHLPNAAALPAGSPERHLLQTLAACDNGAADESQTLALSRWQSEIGLDLDLAGIVLEDFRQRSRRLQRGWPPAEPSAAEDQEASASILRGCLAADPARLEQRAEELARDLRHFLAGDP